jgi:hypothetical protein
MVISDDKTGRLFGDHIVEASRAFADSASISAGIDFAMTELDRAPYETHRRVIDVSGDGDNNSGHDVTRDEAIARGVTINGLVTWLRRQPSGTPATPTLLVGLQTTTATTLSAVVKAVKLDIKLQNLANGNYTAFFLDCGRADRGDTILRGVMAAEKPLLPSISCPLDTRVSAVCTCPISRPRDWIATPRFMATGMPTRSHFLPCPYPLSPKPISDPEMELDCPKHHGGNHVGRAIVGYMR